MFLLVPAHLGCPGQNPESHKTVVCVLSVVMVNFLHLLFFEGCFFGFAKLFSCSLVFRRHRNEVTGMVCACVSSQRSASDRLLDVAGVSLAIQRRTTRCSTRTQSSADEERSGTIIDDTPASGFVSSMLVALSTFTVNVYK